MSDYTLWHTTSGNMIASCASLDEALAVVRDEIVSNPEDRDGFALEFYDGNRSYVLGQQEVLARAAEASA